jgi:hypothetical protein
MRLIPEAVHSSSHEVALDLANVWMAAGASRTKAAAQSAKVATIFLDPA